MESGTRPGLADGFESMEKTPALSMPQSKDGSQTVITAAVDEDPSLANAGKKPLKFWMCIIAVMIASFLIMMEMVQYGLCHSAAEANSNMFYNVRAESVQLFQLSSQTCKARSSFGSVRRTH